MKGFKIIFVAIIVLVSISFVFTDDSNSTQPNQAKEHTEISSIQDLNDYLNRNQNNTFLFVGEKWSRDFNLTRKSTTRGSNFIWSNSKDLRTHFQIPLNQSELVFFKFSKKNVHKQGVKIDLVSKRQKIRFIKIAIRAFVKPSVELVTDENVDSIMDPGYPSLIIIKSEKLNTAETTKFTNILANLERTFRGKLKFYLCNYDEGQNNLLVNDVFHLNVSQLPSAVIVDGLHSSFSSELKKIQYNGQEVSLESMHKFIDDYSNNRLDIHITSEEVPANPFDEYGVFKIVTKNVDSLMDNSAGKDIVILSCIDTKDCTVVRERIRNIARKTSSTKSLILGEFNPKLNEVDSIYINKIPHIVVYPDSPNRLKAKVNYRGSFTTKDIMNFIKKNAKHPVSESKLPNEEAVYREEYKYMVKPVALHQEEYNRLMKNANSTDDNSTASNPELETLRQLIEDEEQGKEGEYVDQEEEEENSPEEEENKKEDL